MSQIIDQRTVEIRFDNKQFEREVSNTMSTLDKFKSKLDKTVGDKTVAKGLETSLNGVDFNKLNRTMDTLYKRFSFGGELVRKMTLGVVDDILGGFKKISNQAISGGMNRVLNLEQAKHLMAGLKLDVDAIMENVSNAVDGTAASLDEAALVAANFGTAGMKAGQEMEDTLRTIAAMSSMAGVEYGRVGDIFGTVASNGKLMLMQVRQFSAMGLNVVEPLAKEFGVTESEMEKLITKGEVDFSKFASIMTQKFGEAAGANDTFTGSLANMKSALNRIGAEFMSPIVSEGTKVFNAVRVTLNAIKKEMGGIFSSWSTFVKTISTGLIDTINNPSTITAYTSIVKSIGGVFSTIMDVVSAIKNAFYSVFGHSLLESIANFFEKIADKLTNIKLKAGVIKDLENGFKGLFSIVKAVSFVLSKLTVVIGPLVRILIKAFGIVGSIVTTIINIPSHIVDFINTLIKLQNGTISLEEVFEKLRDTFVKTVSNSKPLRIILTALLVPIGALIALINKLTAGFGGINRILSKVTSVAKTAFNFVKTGVLNLINTIKELIGMSHVSAQELNNVTSDIQQNGLQMFKFSDILDLIKTKIQSFIEILKRFKNEPNTVFKQIKDWFDGLRKRYPFLNKIYDILSKIGKVIQKITPYVKTFIKAIYENRGFIAALGAIKLIMDGLNGVKETIDNVTEMVGNWNETVNNIVGIGDRAITSFSEPFQKLAELFEQMAEKEETDAFVEKVKAIGIAIGGLAIAVAVFSKIPWDQVKNGLIAVGSLSAMVAILVAVTTAADILSKKYGTGELNEAAKAFAMAAGSIALISVALWVLSETIKKSKDGLGGASFWEMAQALIIIAITIVEFAGGIFLAAQALSLAPQVELGLIAIVGSFLTFSISIALIASAITGMAKEFAKIKGLNDLVMENMQTMIGLIAAIGAFGLAGGLMLKTVGFAFLGVAAGVWAISKIIKIITPENIAAAKQLVEGFQEALNLYIEWFATLTWWQAIIEISRAMVITTVIGLGIIAAQIANQFLKFGIALMSLAIGVGIIAVAVKILSKITPKEFDRAAGVLFVCGAVLGGLMFLMSMFLQGREGQWIKMGVFILLFTAALSSLAGVFVVISYLAFFIDNAMFAKAEIIFVTIGLLMLSIIHLAKDAQNVSWALGLVTVSMVGLVALMLAIVVFSQTVTPAQLGLFGILFGGLLGVLGLIALVIHQAKSIENWTQFAGVAGIIVSFAIITSLMIPLANKPWQGILAGFIGLSAVIGMVTILCRETMKFVGWNPWPLVLVMGALGYVVGKLSLFAAVSSFESAIATVVSLGMLLYAIYRIQGYFKSFLWKDIIATFFGLWIFADNLAAFALAMRKFDGMDPAGALVGILSYFLYLQVIERAAFSFRAARWKEYLTAFIVLQLLSYPLIAFAKSMQEFNGLNFGSAVAGILSLVGAVLAITVMGTVIQNSGSYLGVGVALLSMTALAWILKTQFVPALIALQQIDFSSLKDGLIGLGILIGAFSVLIGAISALTIGSGGVAILGLVAAFASLFALAYLMGFFADVVMKMATSFTALAPALQNVGMVLMSSLIPALMMLGSMPLESVLTALLGLGGAFAILGAAGIFVGPLIPIITQLVMILSMMPPILVAAGQAFLTFSIYFTNAMRNLSVGVDIAIIKLKQLVAAGIAAPAGLIKGIISGTRACMEAGASMGLSVIKGFAEAVGWHSPWESTEEAMIDGVFGLVKGEKTMEDVIKDAGASMGNKALEGLSEKLGGFFNMGLLSGDNFIAGLTSKLSSLDFGGDSIFGLFDGVLNKKETRKKRTLSSAEEKAYKDKLAKLKKGGLSAIEERILRKEIDEMLYGKGDGKKKDDNVANQIIGDLGLDNLEDQLDLDNIGGGSGGGGGGGGGGGAEEAKEDIKDLGSFFDQASDHITNFKEHFKDAFGDSNENDAIAYSTLAIQNFAEGVLAASDSVKEFELQEDGTYKQVMTHETALAQALDEYKDNLVKAIKIDPFSEFEKKTELTGQKLMENIRSQLEGVREWQANLITLRKKGLSQQVIDALAMEGPQSYEKVHAFLDLTADELTEYGKLYGEAATIPEEIANNLISEFAQVGMETTQGFADGMDASVPVGKIKEIGNETVQALKDALGVASPSTVMRQIGQFINEGLRLGLFEFQDLPIAQMEITSSDIYDEADERLNKAKFAKMGENIVLGLRNGIRDNKELVINEAKQLASEIDATMRESLEIASPSVKMMQIGRYIDEGLAVGMTMYSGIVTSASSAIADDAMSSVNDSLSWIYGQSDHIFSGRPIITPGIDLTEVEAGARRANGLFNSAHSYRMGLLTGSASTYNNTTNGYNVTINAPTGNGRDIARAFEEYLVRR